MSTPIVLEHEPNANPDAVDITQGVKLSDMFRNIGAAFDDVEVADRIAALNINLDVLSILTLRRMLFAIGWDCDTGRRTEDFQYLGTVTTSELMATKIVYKQEATYPEKSGEDLMRDIDNDELMLDALVDIVNRSPDAVGQWANNLGIDITEFIETCHRQRKVSDSFRGKVRSYFTREEKTG